MKLETLELEMAYIGEYNGYKNALALPPPNHDYYPRRQLNHREVKISQQERFRRDLDEQVRLKNERKQRENHHQVVLPDRQREMRQGVALDCRRFDGLLHQPHEPNLPRYNKMIHRPHLQESGRIISAPSLTLDPRENTNRTPRGTVYSRFQFDRAAPEVQNEIQDRHRKQQEVDRMLREQLEEKLRRKEEEKRRLDDEERYERERLEREREELRQAYEREKVTIYEHGRPEDH